MNITQRAAKVHHFIARDFSVKVRNELFRKGVVIVGCCVIPGGGDLGWANGTRGYQLSDNGTMRIRSHSEVCAMANL